MSFEYNNYEDLTRNEIFDLLRQWRDNNERRGDEPLILLETLSTTGEPLQKLGSEKYVIIEQLIYAALDCHDYSTAMMYVMMLSAEFPGSLRVMRHKAAILEAEERYDEALEVLDYIIKADETNSAARKRRIAVLKAQGLITEAIKELVDYLKKFMSDMEAWQELSELYLQVQEYSKAAFCGEELILHQPHNHLMHQRLGDIRYTMGGIENMELAKSYYSQALKLNPDNTRALLGLFLVSNALLGQYKGSGGAKRAEAWRLSQWTQRSAAARAASADGPDLAAVMTQLAITDQ